MAIAPRVVSKINTAAQILLAAIVLGDLAFTFDFATIRVALIYVVGISTMVSAAVYLVEWVRHMGTEVPASRPDPSSVRRTEP